MAGQGLMFPTLQDPRELEKLIERVSSIQPRRILEVGSLYGGTLTTWMQRWPGSLVVSVDLVPEGVAQHSTEQVRSARRAWPEWARYTRCELHALEGRSDDEKILWEVMKHAPFDFIFIDSGHKYAEVQGDFEHYWPMLRQGRLMAFHDIGVIDEDPSIDCGRWWNELKREWGERMEEFIETPGQWGIGVIQK